MKHNDNNNNNNNNNGNILKLLFEFLVTTDANIALFLL